MMRQKVRSKPWLPDGSEVYIGAFFALILGLFMLNKDMPWFTAIPAALFLFLAISYGYQVWNEDDRQYWRGVKLAEELKDLLSFVKHSTKSHFLDESHQKLIFDGVENCTAVIEELLRLPSTTRMYGGMTQLEPLVRRINFGLEKYLDIRAHPRKAGNKYTEIVENIQQGFQGFCEESERLLQKVSAGDIFNLTVTAELLRSLRNLLGTKKEAK